MSIEKYELDAMAREIEKLTAERDEWKARCEFSFEQRERLTIHLDDCMNLDKYRLKSLKAIEKERDAYAAAADSMAAAHKVERDALKEAARMALDVCIEMRRYGNQRSVAMAIGAEAALKAVL